MLLQSNEISIYKKKIYKRTTLNENYTSSPRTCNFYMALCQKQLRSNESGLYIHYKYSYIFIIIQVM